MDKAAQVMVRLGFSDSEYLSQAVLLSTDVTELLTVAVVQLWQRHLISRSCLL